jgi:predicted acylesterase/phospholipase RssA
LVEVGVVLQGGGALGAYECGALNALLELMEEYSAQGHRIQLKVVSGVSIGSINAACVVGAKSSADARARLNAIWDDLMLEAPPFWMQAAQRDLAYFGLPGFYTPRPDFWTAPTWTYVYDTRPLLVTLGRHVDFAALNASATAFAVTAVEVVTGTLRAFVNQPLGKGYRDQDRTTPRAGERQPAAGIPVDRNRGHAALGWRPCRQYSARLGH